MSFSGDERLSGRQVADELMQLDQNATGSLVGLLVNLAKRVDELNRECVKLRKDVEFLKTGESIIE